MRILGRAGKERLTKGFFQRFTGPGSLCWLLVASVGQNRPVRTPHAVSCSEPVPQRKSTIESMHLLIFKKGKWTLCRGFSRSSRA
jgi:hypothetical protein